MSFSIETLRHALSSPFLGFVALGVSALFFIALAWIVKRRAAVADADGLARESRINLIMAVLSLFIVGPLVTLYIGSLGGLLRTYGLHLQAPALWARIGMWPTLLAAVFVGDFVGYWRHRAQHTRWLWPAHAVHHSDPRLSWLSLERMHPVDQFGTALDTVILGALGFPFWALAGNTFVRHYWGYFIHADVPWTLGKAGLVLNSPAMHRWHHARDVDGAGHNFATVFSVFDRLFGTLHLPGPCDAPLGVRDDMGRGAVGQYLHPFRVWLAPLWPAARAAESSEPPIA